MRREGQRLAHELYRSDPEKARTAAAERGFPCNRRLIPGWNVAIDPPLGFTASGGTGPEKTLLDLACGCGRG
jgi:hypothetical protein